MPKFELANILLEKHLNELGFEFEREFWFASPRKWRFDYYLCGEMIAVEIEGGVYSQGRHVRGKGYEADLEKYNEAAMRGYRVLRFSTGQVLRGEAKKFLAEWMGR